MANTTTPRAPLIDLTSDSVNARPYSIFTTESKKRKEIDDAPAQYIPDPEDFEWPLYINKTPNQVRGMINRFLDSGAMKKGAFADALGVSGNSLRSFLTSSGMKGAQSATYTEALRFFKQREDAGIKEVKKAKAKPAAATTTAATIDISGITLDGELEGNVEVYDTCDEIRKKINAHLVKAGVTAAQFCRALADQLNDGSKIQSKQLTDFRSYTGASKGNTSKVFYAAYVYFEKRRIAEKKPKSKHRLEMEDTWVNGLDTKTSHNRGYLCLPNHRPIENNLGQVRMTRIA